MKNIELDPSKLREYIEEIERCEGEKSDYTGQITIYYSDAKADGFDTKAMRQIIKERKMEREQKKTHDDICDKYRKALGME